MKIRLVIFLLFMANIVSAQDLASISVKANQPYTNVVNDSLHSAAKKYNTSILRAGLEGGINISNIIYSHSSFFKNGLAGFNAGVNFDIPIEFSFSFAPAILYSQKGYSSQTDFGNYKERLNFIDIPLLFKSELGNSKFYFLIGPQFSFLISSKGTFQNDFTGNQSNYSYNSGKAFIDGVVGVSHQISRCFDIHARYTVDLNKTNSTAMTSGYRSQALQIGLGIKFN